MSVFKSNANKFLIQNPQPLSVLKSLLLIFAVKLPAVRERSGTRAVLSSRLNSFRMAQRLLKGWLLHASLPCCNKQCETVTDKPTIQMKICTKRKSSILIPAGDFGLLFIWGFCLFFTCQKNKQTGVVTAFEVNKVSIFFQSVRRPEKQEINHNCMSGTASIIPAVEIWGSKNTECDTSNAEKKMNPAFWAVAFCSSTSFLLPLHSKALRCSISIKALLRSPEGMSGVQVWMFGKKGDLAWQKGY